MGFCKSVLADFEVCYHTGEIVPLLRLCFFSVCSDISGAVCTVLCMVMVNSVFFFFGSHLYRNWSGLYSLNKQNKLREKKGREK